MNIKSLLTLALSGCLATAVFAQDDTVKKVTIKMTIVNKDTLKKDTTTVIVKKDTCWDFGGIINVAFSQISLTNWAAGGQNSVGLVSMVSLHANYKGTKISWLNSI